MKQICDADATRKTIRKTFTICLSCVFDISNRTMIHRFYAWRKSMRILAVFRDARCEHWVYLKARYWYDRDMCSTVKSTTSLMFYRCGQKKLWNKIKPKRQGHSKFITPFLFNSFPLELKQNQAKHRERKCHFEDDWIFQKLVTVRRMDFQLCNAQQVIALSISSGYNLDQNLL